MSEAPSDEQLRRALADEGPAKAKAAKGRPAREKRKRRPKSKKLKPDVVRVSQDETPDDGLDGIQGSPGTPPPSQASASTPAPVPDSAPASPPGTPAPDSPASAMDAEDAAAREAEMDELRRQLADMRDQMEAMAHTKDQIEGVAEKFTGMEDRMGNLLQLSELLSVQYNPFLEDGEEAVFEGKHDAGDLIGALRRRGRPAPPARERRGPELVRPDLDEPLPLPTDAGPATEGDDAAPPHDANTEPLEDAPSQATDAPAHPPSAPTAKPAPAWEQPTPLPPAPAVRPIGRSREAYLALCWLEHLADSAPDGAVHLLLEHYRRLGWVGEDDYTWLSVLAHSVTVPSDVTWKDFDMSGPELARFHRENMTFLDRLFRTGFEERDPDRWADQASRWLGGS